MLGRDTGARDGAIGKDENNSGGIDVLLDLSYNPFLLECVLLKVASVGQPWCVEYANLAKMLCLPITFKSHDTYHYAVLACKLVQAARVGPTLVVVPKDAKVVVTTLVGDKDIGDEFQDRGLPHSSLSDEKDGGCCSANS